MIPQRRVMGEGEKKEKRKKRLNEPKRAKESENLKPGPETASLNKSRDDFGEKDNHINS